MPIINADCIEHMNTMPPESVDSIVTDPPYHLTSKNGQSKGFMGKEWDGGAIAFRTEVWEAALRVAKPGAYLLAFGGTRTFHRMAVAIEDAGWEIRDTVMYVYGTGFPKSHNVSKAIDKEAGAEREIVGQRVHARKGVKIAEERTAIGAGSFGEERIGNVTVPATDAAKQWDGWGTALKPAWEPILVCRKPLDGTVAQNVLAHGTGAINIDGCRVGSDQLGGGTMPDLRDVGAMSKEASGIDKLSFGQNPRPAKRKEQSVYTGRWPANLIHDGSDEVVALFPVDKPHKMVRNRTLGARPFNNDGKATEYETTETIEDSGGSAARFFYCAKANRADRDEGCEMLEETRRGAMVGNVNDGNFLTGSGNPRQSMGRNHHPTVKPTALMRYLCKLVTRLGGVVLDPFCGSGSTGKAAILEGFRFIGIEKEFEYCEIANARISKTDM